MAGALPLRAFLLSVAMLMATMAQLTPTPGPSDIDWYQAEVDFLALLKSRRTGSPSHNMLIDHIETELKTLGFQVRSDTLNFTYENTPLDVPKLAVEGQVVAISSAVPYSGVTDLSGVGGPLVNLMGPDQPPEWSRASGGIAVVNVTNSRLNEGELLTLWPGSPAWTYAIGNPALTSEGTVANLSKAAEAGVKAIVYVWEEISSGNAFGQYVPFHNPYMGCPAVYVAKEAATAVLDAANRSAVATLTIPGSLVSDTPTRSIWTVIEGTELQNESIIINTHTDGVNLVEENGHIALLAKARQLASSPPKRTTILAFITGHIHTAAFSNTSRATTRWLVDNPGLWMGGQGRMKAVFGSCVEHLGAVNWTEDLNRDLYYPTGKQEDEYLFAAPQELASIVQQQWIGAVPNVTRIINPLDSPIQQPGEGQPFLAARIPEVSLVTSPSWLLKEWQEDFDERQLMDIMAAKRQVESFLRIWDTVDRMPASAFGTVPA